MPELFNVAKEPTHEINEQGEKVTVLDKGSELTGEEHKILGQLARGESAETYDMGLIANQVAHYIADKQELDQRFGKPSDLASDLIYGYYRDIMLKNGGEPLSPQQLMDEELAESRKNNAPYRTQEYTGYTSIDSQETDEDLVALAGDIIGPVAPEGWNEQPDIEIEEEIGDEELYQEKGIAGIDANGEIMNPSEYYQEFTAGVEAISDPFITELEDTKTIDDLLSSGKKIVLDISATWCGPCKAAYPSLQVFAGENKDNEGIEVAHIEIDKQEYVYDYLLKKLGKEPRATQFPTLLYIENNTVLRRHEGGFNSGDITETIDQLT